VTNDPRTAYEKLLAERRADIVEREARHRRLGYLRLAVVVGAVAIVWIALASDAFSIAWALAPIAVFTGLLIVGDRLLRDLQRRRRAALYFERALGRLDGKWQGAGEPGDRYLRPEHPYAQDLDLFGKGSLFELLCTARTHIGEDTLARWLLNPADPDSIRARQQAVEELRPRLDLREDLAVLGEEARSGVDPVALAAWGEAPPLLGGTGKRALLWLLSAIGTAGFIALWVSILYLVGLIQISVRTAATTREVFFIALLINGYYLYRHRHIFPNVVGDVEEAAHGLTLLSAVLLRLEKEQFRSHLLSNLRNSLDAAGEPPSRRLERLDRIMDRVDSRDNPFVRMLETFIMWTPHQALSVENWRRESGPAVRRWLMATGEIEALSSLACHAFEHPADPFPEVVPGGPMLEAEAIGHPLIPEDHVVRNDIQLGGVRQLFVVSGSNMSGKSTMLRTLGINSVLAQAGAPVRARSMRLSQLAVGASIRLNDSLQGGVSRFYAEILRLRQILDLTSGSMPVLFLIDEFLHGTNSHDRRIGAEAVVRSLVERGAIGLITTHDLALADIAAVLGERAVNVHFEDQISDGQIHFDYVMRAGIVRKSNAIELMRSVGLEI